VAKNVKGKAATPNFCHQPSSSLKLGGVPNYGVVSSGKEPNTPLIGQLFFQPVRQRPCNNEPHLCDS